MCSGAGLLVFGLGAVLSSPINRHETLHTLAVDGRPLRFEYLRHHAAAEKWMLQM